MSLWRRLNSSDFQEKDRNGDLDSRDRSPIRSDSSPQIIEVNPSKSESRKDDENVLDMRIESSLPRQSSRPPSASRGGGDPRRDDEICIVMEKEGIRGPPVITGRTSVNSDHSINTIHRINGLEDRPSSRQSLLHVHRNSPTVNGPHKSDSPSVKGYGLPPTSLPSSYYSRSHMLPVSTDPYGRSVLTPTSYGLPSHQMAPHHMAASSMAMLGHHILGGVSIRPPNPFDHAAALDPFRDPYRMDLFRDPLREARERELMRLSELDHAKALQMAGYAMPGYYPPTTLGHKMVGPHLSSPYSAASVPPTLGLPPLGLGHPLGMNGAPGIPPTYSKDPLRR